MYRPQAFHGTVTAVGDRTGIALPFDPDKVWGPRGRHTVEGTIGGHAWRGPLDQIGDGLAVAIDTAWHDTHIGIGATVEVVLAAEDPRVDNVAPDVAAALAADPEAHAFFDGLAGHYPRNFMRRTESAGWPRLPLGVAPREWPC